eukprot:scaffold1852_cov54-Phaeocystis_antarctica.AAC.2
MTPVSCGPNGAWRVTPAVAVVSRTAWLLHAAPLVSRSVRSSELAGSACWNCRRQLPALPARKATPGSAGAHSAHWPFHSSGMSRLGIAASRCGPNGRARGAMFGSRRGLGVCKFSLHCVPFTSPALAQIAFDRPSRSRARLSDPRPSFSSWHPPAVRRQRPPRASPPS